ncbi:ArsR/SmtB family transcription factor [Hydrogenophaga sp.]|uniref:ArsR/SmtB family transcription factor n=1 Tax=Hydrogenophaga sp. TaxID=1904254 RepID=UPI003D10F86D
MNTNRIAHVAALVGEPARTAMLLSLMDGRALTARELADVARVTPATASRHLGLMVEASLLKVERQGRHRYHRLASTEVARLLEGVMQLAASAPPPVQRRMVVGPRDLALRTARTCYDHLAGRLGVAIAGHLQDVGAVVFDEGEAAAGHVTDAAAPALQRLGLPPEAARDDDRSRRLHCRPCMDWSERRMHIAGRLGALICQHCLESGWLLRGQGTRALAFSPRGEMVLRDWMGAARWQEVSAAD